MREPDPHFVVCPVCGVAMGYRVCCPACLRNALRIHWFFHKVLRLPKERR